jgi:hypothetical protein
MGKPVIKKQSTPIPLKYSPADLMKSKLSFGTNQKYLSLNRTITYPLKFIKDGADILRWIDYNTNGYESKCYLTVLKLNALTGVNELAYKGRIDFSRKQDDPRTGYTVSTLDESAWSILSANENVTYRIDCSPTNPKAVKVLFDGVTLNNRVTYQPTAIGVTLQSCLLPISLINQEWRWCTGLIFNNQSLFVVPALFVGNTYDVLKSGGLIRAVRATNNITVNGIYSYIGNCPNPATVFFKLIRATNGKLITLPTILHRALINGTAK